MDVVEDPFGIKASRGYQICQVTSSTRLDLKHYANHHSSELPDHARGVSSRLRINKLFFSLDKVGWGGVQRYIEVNNLRRGNHAPQTQTPPSATHRIESSTSSRGSVVGSVPTTFRCRESHDVPK
jgi:hypothetical protein